MRRSLPPAAAAPDRRCRARAVLLVAVVLGGGGAGPATAREPAASGDATTRSGPSPAAAQERGDTAGAGRALTLHPEARRAISLIRSPYCPGLMLEVCPSPGADALRDSIEARARAGLSADSIVELVIAEHGEEWRALPPREGVGRWAWLVPPLVLVFGGVVVAVLLSRRVRSGTRDEAPLADAEDEGRLRDALDELDRSERPEW